MITPNKARSTARRLINKNKQLFNKLSMKKKTSNKPSSDKATETLDTTIDEMPIHAVPFIYVSTLFKGCELALDFYYNSFSPCSCEDNRHSLVCPQTIRACLYKDKGNSDLAHQIRKVERRICTLPPGIYVNLKY